MTVAPPVSPHLMWHEVECGRYAADLPLWGELARAAPGGVLDVGAGTGRVALRLAHDGHAVTALDRDPELLAELTDRARRAGLTIPTVTADAARFELSGFGLVAVPMQTIQLLPDAAARAGFFASARAALVPGGRVALAIAFELEAFEAALPLPRPDLGEVEGWRFVSQPVAIRPEDGAARIERLRHMIAPDGTCTTEPDSIRLATVTPAGLAEEGAAHGLEAEELRIIPETDEHVASLAVVFRG